MSKTIKGYKYINVGCSHHEMIPEWLGITIWEGEYGGLEVLPYNEDEIPVYRHKDGGGDVINHNVNNGLPFEDSSVEVVFSSHFIEHLTFEEGINFLKECHRVLRPDGILRISCPDMKLWIDKVYHSNDKEFFETYKSQLEDTPHWENYLYPFKDNIKTNIQVFNSMIFNWGHKWMWDYESLKTQLESIGYHSIERKEHLKSDIHIIENIETRLSKELIEARNLESMFVECRVKKGNTIL